MGFTNRAHIKKLIFRTLSKYLVYRISMNIFSEEPFLSPTRLYGQYPPSQSYLQNKASWLIPLEKYVWGIISPPSFFFLQLYPPGLLHNRLIRFLSTFCIHLSRGPENLWVRRRDVLIEMHGSHAVSMKKGREKGRDVLGNSSPAT